MALAASLNHVSRIPGAQSEALSSTAKNRSGRIIRRLHVRKATSPIQAISTENSTTTALPAVEAAPHEAAAPPAFRRRVSAPDLFKGWLDNNQLLEDQKLLAKLRLLQVTISDRKEMHAIIGQQRDNWNKLFQGTLRLATVSAALLAAVSGAVCTVNGATTVSLALPAGVLDIVAALIMVMVNKFQPSQLAEEQRTAVRQFEYLNQEVEATLAISPALREDAGYFVRDKTSKLHALDSAYPLPLTPGGLPKFPDTIFPAPSGTVYDDSAPVILDGAVNGWSRAIEDDLLRISSFLGKDIDNYLHMCKIILTANKTLAIGAPVMAFLAGVVNVGNCYPLPAALLSVGAFFAGSLSHDMQLGMIFEMYRNCAGYYADVAATIQRTLRMPVELREDGELFHQRIVHRLGRKVEFPSIPKGAQTAGTLF